MLNTLDILFKTRTPKKLTSGAANQRKRRTIYARVTINGIPKDISTNVRVDADFWDAKNQRIADGWPTAADDNQRLTKFKTRLYRAFNRLDDDEAVLSPAEVINQFNGKKRTVLPLTELMGRMLAYQKSRTSSDADELARRDFITKRTYDAYAKYAGNVTDYLTYSRQTGVLISAIDEEWMADFRHWGRKYETNYLGKHVYYLKCLLDYAVLKKLLPGNPIKPLRVERMQPDVDTMTFLYTDEIDRLKTFDFASIEGMKPARAERLGRVRDVFIFMQEIGTHYTDYMRFVAAPARSMSVVQGVAFLRMKRQKTSKCLITPLTPVCLGLAEQYGGFDKLPTMSLTQYNDGLNLISTHLRLGKFLTSKAARKTFTDQLLNEAVVDETTAARRMGLASVAYIKHYGRTDERRLIKVLGLQTPATPLPAGSSNALQI
jgi:hypothetical protein